jgi:uncharacterized cupredoxin-like copper-binding protein
MKFISYKPLAFVLTAGVAASMALASTSTQHEHAHDMHGASGASAVQSDSAIGVAGQAGKVNRTIEVVMNDTMRFTPDKLTVKAGDTVRFVVKNAGQLKHEFNIGSTASQKEHAELMLKHSDMQHAEPNVASVLPGKTGEVIWKFTRPGIVTFACLQPGHLSSGMKGSIQVSAR